LDDKVAGTVALLKVSEGIFELSKMAVSEEFQGRKIVINWLNTALK
jgi:N-acetylglutamate synthase-like GNAT family acetyltransferase